LVEFLYTMAGVALVPGNSSSHGGPAMPRTPFSPEREAEAQQLAQAIRQATADEVLDIARALVATEEATLFGDTEFQVRDLVHKIGAKAYQAYLAQKKTATAGLL
jgi:hypothetical protein